MSQLKCHPCQAVLSVVRTGAGAVGVCPVCMKKYRIPPALAGAAVPQEEGAGEDDLPEVIAVVEARPDLPAPEVTAERPPRREPEWEDDRPRRRRRSDGSGEFEFSLIEAIPIDYVSQVNLGVGIGLILNLIIVLITQRSLVSVLLILPAIVFWCWGCAAYAKNKGYSEFFGFLGLFGLPGLIVLVLLRDRAPD